MAKKRKNAVPKRIAGMKVPKSLRKGRVGELLSSPVGQALIIETVARAGEHLIGRQTRPGSAMRKGAVRSQETISDLGENASESSAAVVYALRQAARAFVAAMQEQQAAGRAEAGREAAGDEEKVEKKTRASARTAVRPTEPAGARPPPLRRPGGRPSGPRPGPVPDPAAGAGVAASRAGPKGRRGAA